MFNNLNIVTWDQYKQAISDFAKNGTRLIYRGQQNSEWDLETSFVRENRNVLTKYTYEQYKWLISILNMRYTSHLIKENIDLNNKFTVLNYVSFLQQHGFPTPLLDWTESPYIAAYFAFKDLGSITGNVTHVKIFAFDNTSWHHPQGGLETIYEMPSTKQHLTVFYPDSKYNPRLVHQQGVHTISNVENINNHIFKYENQFDKKFLYIYDLPVKERPHVMRDLHMMGISEMSLFPGLDGTCEYLKQRIFRDYVPINDQDIKRMLKDIQELKKDIPEKKQ